ncbi:MAG TPA: AI-2E family transporter [Jatrophihabitans sp.]|nr:AI-2E family transporter [Jatrophihabitans sp.]
MTDNGGTGQPVDSDAAAGRAPEDEGERTAETTDAPAGAPTPVPRGNPAEAVAWSLRATAEWCWRILIVVATLYLVGKAYQKVHLVVFSFVVGLLIAAVLRPVFRRLVAWRFPPALAALSSVLLAVLVLAGVGYFVADQISSNSGELANQLQRSVKEFTNWLTTGPLHLKQSDLNGISDKITASIKANQTAIAESAVSTLQSVAEGLSGLLLVILTAFFLIKDGEKIWGWTLSMLPRNARPRVAEAGERSWSTLGGYVRGQVTIALFHAVTITVALLVFRVPLAAALGVLVFLGSFIPLFGMIVAGGMCVVVALIERGLVTSIVILCIVVALVQLESHVLQPLIMSRAVEIHPLAVAVTVIAGTNLDGIYGALLAVPLVAVGNTALRSLHGQVIDTEPERPLRPRFRPKRRTGSDPVIVDQRSS